jgi:hypothetical protein
MKRAMMQMSFEVAKVIGVIGALVLLISGLLSFALPIVAVGLVALIILRQLKHLMWSAIIIVVGAIAYTLVGGGSLWSYGPVLVIVAGVIAVITHVL